MKMRAVIEGILALLAFGLVIAFFTSKAKAGEMYCAHSTHNHIWCVDKLNKLPSNLRDQAEHRPDMSIFSYDRFTYGLDLESTETKAKEQSADVGSNPTESTN